mgnify:CR=1 FL=1
MLKSYNDLILSDNIDELNLTPETLSGFFVAFYCENGALQFTEENERHLVEDGDMLVFTPRKIIGSYMRTPDLRGKIICFGTSLLDDSVPEIFQIDKNCWKKLIYLSRNPVFRASEFQRNLFLAYFNLIEVYLDDCANTYRKRSIKLLAQSVIVEMLHELDDLHLLGENEEEAAAEVSRKDKLFQHFIAMLTHPGNTEREVKAYANRLLVTPKYLSHVCKEKCGRTASDLIAEATVRNIKYYLLQTDLTVKEIAYKMDFADISFFCKYTKKHLGRSPMEYRKALWA